MLEREDCNAGETRAALVDNIIRNIDNVRIASAMSIPQKNARLDAIANVIREAVIVSPIVVFNGVPHTYVESYGCYRRIKWSDIGDSIYVVMRRIGVKDGDYGRIEQFTKIISRAISDREEPIDNSVVVMSNGVYDTMDGSLHPYSSEYMTNTKVNFSYDKNSYAMLWERFLEEVLPEKEMRDLLQEFVGACYVVRKYAKIESMLILLGNGQNGKSVIFEVISALLGSENISHFYLSELIGGQRREQNIAACSGKRLNYCSEIKTNEIGESNADAVKSIISGEPVMGRRLFCEPEIVRDIPLLMANANMLPRIVTPSDSLKRRILVIPFDVTIPSEKQNLELSSDLKQNLSGVFNWAMKGLERLRSNGYKLSVPQKVTDIVNEYMDDNSPVMSFLKDSLYRPSIERSTSKNSLWIPTSVLYREFSEWCSFNYIDAMSIQRFVREMKSSKYQQVRRSSGSGFVVYKKESYEGIVANEVKRAESLIEKNIILQPRKLVDNDGDVKVLGVNDSERYLGLPIDTIWDYLSNGSLEGTYRRTDNGPLFNVRALLAKLAYCGYFKKLEEDGLSNVKHESTHAIKGMRRKFNNEMRTRGLPFRQYGNTHHHIPENEKNCIIVPDGWRYTPENVAKIMKEHELKTN